MQLFVANKLNTKEARFIIFFSIGEEEKNE